MRIAAPKPALIASLAMALGSSANALPRLVEYEAESQTTSGRIIQADRTFGTLAAEASARRAVELSGFDQAIEIRLSAPANALTIRYSLPPSRQGTRLPATALIRADDQTIGRVLLTSRYAYDPEALHPRSGALIHHFWAETRMLLPHVLAAGTKLVLSLARASVAPEVAIDLVDAELLKAPRGRPPRSISLSDFGADSSGRKDSTRAVAEAVDAARRLRQTLYIPAGRFRVNGHIIVDDQRIVGAGSWYSVLSGHQLGLYSSAKGSRRVALSGFAIESDVSDRQDSAPLAAIGGSYSGSTFENLYLHGAKVGIWLDGPAHGLLIRNVEIADQAADGINLQRGIRHALVEDNRIRNTGDDGIASWSDGISNAAIVIRRNRIASPGLANGIAIYGGRDLAITGNEISDVLIEGGGIHLGARFHSTPFGGSIRIADNRIVRSASMDPHWHFGIGAIWFYALERPIAASIRLLNNVIEDPGCEALQLIGPRSINGVSIDGLRVTGSATSLFSLQTDGSMIAKNVLIDHARAPLKIEVPFGFHLASGGGKREWVARAVRQAPSPSCI